MQSVWAQTPAGSTGTALAGQDTAHSLPINMLSSLGAVANPTPIQVSLPRSDISRSSEEQLTLTPDQLWHQGLRPQLVNRHGQLNFVTVPGNW